MTEVTMVEAIRLALARAMQDDPTVLVLGEDVGKDGGVFSATDGLLARFGPKRVLDTPLAEAAIAKRVPGVCLSAERQAPPGTRCIRASSEGTGGGETCSRTSRARR